MRNTLIALLVSFHCFSATAQVVSSIDLSAPIIENNMAFVVNTNPAAEAYSDATTISGIELKHSRHLNNEDPFYAYE